MPDMNLTSAGIISASVVIGVGAAVTIFDAATGLGSSSSSVQSPVSLRTDERGADRGPRRFAPCERPAKLVDGACVTDVTRTVVVPPAAQQSAPAPVRRAQPAPAAPQQPPVAVRTDDDGRRHGHDDDDYDDDDRDDDDRDDDDRDDDDRDDDDRDDDDD